MRLGVEAGLPTSVRAALEARGHAVETVAPLAVGGGQAVVRLGRGWVAGSDPRKDGQAGGH
jgi:gamma-glutamyltranspeptidase / glutathione hydrolase